MDRAFLVRARGNAETDVRRTIAVLLEHAVYSVFDENGQKRGREGNDNGGRENGIKGTSADMDDVCSRTLGFNVSIALYG